jgi:hypothetical protein
MARIRSTHPGQWSDEDFVAMSFPARILTLALRNIADDHGVFEWKPLTIKMQLLPADSLDVTPLLSEMVANNIAIEFEAEGKRYGAIRNFMKWQRPKKPSYQHPCPEHVLEYVGVNVGVSRTDETSGGHSSTPVGNRYGTGSENAQQRKEEGGRKKEEKNSCPKPAGGRISYPPEFEAVWKAYPTDANMSKSKALAAWRKLAVGDQQLVAKSIPAFRDYCAADASYRPVHFVRFITDRRFEGFADVSRKAPVPRANGGTHQLRDADGNLTLAAMFARG